MERDDLEDMGPIDYVVVEFPGSRMTGEGLPLLVDLVDRGIIRILDLVFVKKELDGSVSAVALADLDKDGDLDGLRCDSGIVFVAGRSAAGADAARPFVISVMTAYLQDDRAGEAFIGDVTRAAWDYFEALARSTEHGRKID